MINPAPKNRVVGWDSEWSGDWYMACFVDGSGTTTTLHTKREAAVTVYNLLSGGVTLCSHSLADYQVLLDQPTVIPGQSNANALVRALARHGDQLIDTYVLYRMINENGRAGLKYLSKSVLGVELQDPISVRETEHGTQTLFNGLPIQLCEKAAEEYCAADAKASMDLYYTLWPKLSGSQREWYESTEQPFQTAVLGMYYRGISVDTDALEEQRVRMAEEVKVRRGAVCLALGYDVNLDSHPAMASVLFSPEYVCKRHHREQIGVLKTCPHGKPEGKCKHPECPGLRPKYGYVDVSFPGLDLVPKPGYTEGGQYKTDDATLQLYAGNSVVSGLLDYREAKKLSEFLESWSRFLGQDGKLRARIDQVGTVTGRVSCRDPNLQQVPKRGKLAKPLRSLFVASAEDHVLVVCDQDSIEARVNAAFARETTELARFNSGVDVHDALAKDLSATLGMTVTRDAAKTVRYSLLYGAGPQRLSATLSRYGFPCTVPVAKRIIAAFYQVLPRTKEWQARVHKAAERTGTVRTLGGRTRHLTGVYADTPAERQKALRQAGNSVVQGSASDLTKRWIVRLQNRGAPMVLCVHDEVILDCRFSNAPWWCQALEEELQLAALDLGLTACPITGTARAGRTWGEAKG